MASKKPSTDERLDRIEQLLIDQFNVAEALVRPEAVEAAAEEEAKAEAKAQKDAEKEEAKAAA